MKGSKECHRGPEAEGQRERERAERAPVYTWRLNHSFIPWTIKPSIHSAGCHQASARLPHPSTDRLLLLLLRMNEWRRNKRKIVKVSSFQNVKKKREKSFTQTHDDHFLCSDIFLHVQKYKTLKKPFGHLYDNHPIKNKAPEQVRTSLFFIHSWHQIIEERLWTIWSRKGKKEREKNDDGSSNSHIHVLLQYEKRRVSLFYMKLLRDSRSIIRLAAASRSLFFSCKRAKVTCNVISSRIKCVLACVRAWVVAWVKLRKHPLMQWYTLVFKWEIGLLKFFFFFLISWPDLIWKDEIML